LFLEAAGGLVTRCTTHCPKGANVAFVTHGKILFWGIMLCGVVMLLMWRELRKTPKEIVIKKRKDDWGDWHK